ncbi:RNA-guided endonuclease InsQ/TnpB family protein [Nocardia asiatica]
MQLRYNFRLYPTVGQQRSLAKAFGCARTVFNDALSARERARRDGLPYVKDAELSKALTVSKKAPERAWLSDVSSVVLQQALADLNNAYRNFFSSIEGSRKGAIVGPPKFRSRRDSRQSIRLTRNGFSLRSNGKLYLAKVGELKVAWSRELPSPPSSVTVVKDAAGRYFASFVVHVESEMLPVSDAEVGIDLGLSAFAVLSSGITIENPRFLRQAERRLKKAQQTLSRKEKGSKNRAKARLKVAKAHAKVADTRRDWAHKHSTQIIRENQAVYVEDLSVKGLARTRLAKSVHDAGWGMFTRMLEEKAARYGRTFGKVDRLFPSTRMCSECSAVGERKPLHVREWTCTCGVTHDRDLNAAKNILAAGLAERLNACGGDVRPARVLVDAREAGTHRNDCAAA